MDLGEDWQSLSVRPVELEECGLGLGREEEGLKSVKLRSVVVPVELLVRAVLVSEHAASAIHALLRVVERPAVLALELFVVTTPGSHCQLILAVGKAASLLLLTVFALKALKPEAAKLSLDLLLPAVLEALVAH